MTPFGSVPDAIERILDTCASPSRRTFLKGSGLLAVSVLASPLGDTQAAAQGAGPYPPVDFRQLDTWIAIHEDSTATFYVGKTDGGQGTGTAFRQLMCDELDLDYDKSTLVMGRTDLTPDQGGSGGSDALQVDAYPARRVAAEARRVLLDLASTRLGVPVAQLTAASGVISLTADPSRGVSYGELVGGRRFNVTLTGASINATTGRAAIKPAGALRITGQPVQRYDIPPKVDGSLKWASGVQVPGMVHARNVRPPTAGATLVSVDESSVRNLPGFIRVVTRGNYVAVVCEREEQAITAAQKLKVTWRKAAGAPFPSSEDVYAYMRAAAPTLDGKPDVSGTPDQAMGSAATVLTAAYDWPYQGHTAIGPAHALADWSNGQLTLYSNDMKSYGLRTGVAQFLGMPEDRVRVLWMDGPQLYGRTAADDAGFEAAFLAKTLERPVRVQWMRHEETAWDTKGPAYTFDLKGGMDANGNLVALDYAARAADHNHVNYNDPETVLIAQLMGTRPKPGTGMAAAPSEVYAIPHRRRVTQVVSMPLVWESPLRTGNLRDPNGPQVTFAGESFIDELAAAAKADPVAFRLKLLTAETADDSAFRRARSIAVIKAAAETFGWDPRPSPRRQAAGPIVTGRGIAYCFRNQTVLAEIAEVEVDRRTGYVWVKRLVCAHDCGLVVNPDGLRGTIEGNLLYGLSRTLHEEVRFDTEKVTSVDWVTHPTLTHRDTPERIDVVFVNGDPSPDRPDLPHYGAGEAACRAVAAAVGNAVFDATGVRLRRVPFRDARVLAALRAAGSGT